MFRVKRTTARTHDTHDLNPADRQLLEGITDLLRQNRESRELPDHFRGRLPGAPATDSESS